MKYLKQVFTVTVWEYRRFYKPKNELVGIVIMLILFSFFYLGSKYVMSDTEKNTLTLLENTAPGLVDTLAKEFDVEVISLTAKDQFLKEIIDEKEGLLLLEKDTGYVLHSWKKPAALKLLQKKLNSYTQTKVVEELGITTKQLDKILSPAIVEQLYFDDSGARSVLVYFFAGLMIMAVLVSFAYQFTAITGEKQLKITEQIVSAIKPQAWMDGKILGITLTGLSSVVAYSIISSLGGMLYFQFTDRPVSNIIEILHLPSILIFLAFTMVGIMMWNAMMAAIASVITDPNNSGKSSLMLVPLIFVVASLLVSPDHRAGVFLSWFPLTSATAMPMRWVVSVVDWWELAGSFAVLVITFYLFRKLAAKIFHVSILISGKEPTWKEVWKLAREG
ncbi:ABC-type Na+ efflux pump permease component-like protein [Fulvivirga imtechensis AK7]|uniref:ABC-type Na+ efflux pump permease component-like protein n=1 Tax=Fulvivirga imtechensis AK7 TaxID=1237149 RepID=L8JXA3_9BACT|nr:ABC transporter permease [Fulvivirga imtechensis]ELR73420.1 ABC-type Na+ efflux pump permease component-like protein [Fulvivirga imtechensis AK7]